MSRRRSPALLVSLAVAASALLLAGCGQDLYDGPAADGAASRQEARVTTSPEPSASPPGSGETDRPAPTRAVARAAEGTTARSSRLAMTMSMEGGGFTHTLDAEGAFDWRRGVGEMTLHVPGLGAPVREVVTPRAVYVETPQGWVEMSLRGLPGAGGDRGIGGGDPTAVLDTLSAVANVRRTGSATVRGVRTTRYAATLDAAAVVAQVPPEQSAHMEDLLRAAGVQEIPLEVYVDGQGRLRRLVEDVETTPDGSGPVSVLLTLDLYDFGVPVQVSPPAPDEVTTRVGGGAPAGL